MIIGSVEIVKLIDQFREIFAQKEFHVVVEKGKIWVYFWKERNGSNFIDKLDFDCWSEDFRFYSKF